MLSMYTAPLNVYRPLIQYDWSTTSGTGSRQLIDRGTTPKYDAGMYFGRGAKFNGVDQDITLTSVDAKDTYTMFIGRNDNTSTACSLDNNVWLADTRVASYDSLGALVYTGIPLGELCIVCTPSKLDIYINGIFNQEVIPASGAWHQGANPTIGRRIDTYGAGIVNNYIFIEVNLTPQQIEYQYKYPEKFLYREDNVLKSYILNQSEIDNVVAYLPMCETDGYVRDLANYSEGVDILSQTFIPYGNNTVADNGDGTHSITIVDDGRGAYMIGSYDIDIYKTSIHTLQYTGSNLSSISMYLYASKNYEIFNPIEEGKETLLNITQSSAGNIYFSDNIQVGETLTIGLYTQKLSATYPIQNYTNAVRDDAIQLTKGLQTSSWKRDSLGVPYGGSFDRLECDGVGKFNSGWLIEANKTWQIETIVYADSSTLNENYFIVYPLYLRVKGNAIYTRMDNHNNNTTVNNGYSHVVMTYNGGTDRLLVNTINGISKIGAIVNKIDDYGVLELLPLTTLPLRLFKIHTEPQDPLDLYNQAVKKGLLS